MYYNYSIPYYNNVIPYRSRQFGNFLIPFGLGLVTGPLVFNPRPRPNYYYPRPRPNYYYPRPRPIYYPNYPYY